MSDKAHSVKLVQDLMKALSVTIEDLSEPERLTIQVPHGATPPSPQGVDLSPRYHDIGTHGGPEDFRGTDQDSHYMAQTRITARPRPGDPSCRVCHRGINRLNTDWTADPCEHYNGPPVRDGLYMLNEGLNLPAGAVATAVQKLIKIHESAGNGLGMVTLRATQNGGEITIQQQYLFQRYTYLGCMGQFSVGDKYADPDGLVYEIARKDPNTAEVMLERITARGPATAPLKWVRIDKLRGPDTHWKPYRMA